MERAQVLLDVEQLTQQWQLQEKARFVESHAADVVLRGLKAGLFDEVRRLYREVIADWAEEKACFAQLLEKFGEK
eukprot:gene44902-55884_t